MILIQERRGEMNHPIPFRLTIRAEAVKNVDVAKIVLVHPNQDLDLEVETGIGEQDEKKVNQVVGGAVDQEDGKRTKIHIQTIPVQNMMKGTAVQKDPNGQNVRDQDHHHQKNIKGSDDSCHRI